MKPAPALLAVFVGLGVVPIVLFAMGALHRNAGRSLPSHTSVLGEGGQLMAPLEERLFDRHGTARAQELFSALLEQEDWYVAGSGDNPIAAAMNAYVAEYRVISIVLAVDLTGRPIAINDRGSEGQAISTDWVYQENFGEATWFHRFSGPQRSMMSSNRGPAVEVVASDPLIRRAYDQVGRAFVYSAPLRDGHGELLGVLTQRLDCTAVEEFLRASEAGNPRKQAAWILAALLACGLWAGALGWALARYRRGPRRAAHASECTSAEDDDSGRGAPEAPPGPSPYAPEGSRPARMRDDESRKKDF